MDKWSVPVIVALGTGHTVIVMTSDIQIAHTSRSSGLKLFRWGRFQSRPLFKFTRWRFMKRTFLMFVPILTLIVELALTLPGTDKEKEIVILNRGDGKYEKEIDKRIGFKRILSIGVESGPKYLVFGTQMKVRTDKEQNIYLLDTENRRILRFDKNGNFLWEAGRGGQGPGEFEYPVGLLVTDEEIIVADVSRIHFFDKKGKFKETHRLEKLINDIISYSNNRILASLSITGQTGIATAYFTKEGKLVRIFQSYFGSKIIHDEGARVQVSWGGGYARQFKDEIYICLPECYEIQIYKMDGKLIKKILRDIKITPAKVEVSNSMFSVIEGDEVGPVFPLSNGMLVVKLRYKYKYYLDFFDKNFEFLGSYPIPEDMNLIEVDSFDNFYFLQTYPFPKLVKCSLEWK